MTKKLQKHINELISEKSKIGMVLTLGDKVLNCVNVVETDRGSRYVFNNGIAWTKSNIESNIIFMEQKGTTWSIS